MSFVLDTDVVIEHLRGKRAIQSIGEISSFESTYSISIITYGELRDGIIFGKYRDQEEEDFRRFLRIVDILNLDVEVAEIYATIRGTLRRRGITIGDNDLWIAATALANDLTLVTRNERHYSRISELKVLVL